MEFWGAVILATLVGSIASFAGPIFAAIGSLAGATLGFVLNRRASSIRNKQQLERDRAESISRRLDQVMDENRKRYEASVRERRLRAGRIEQFECENLGYKGDLGGYLMRRIPDGSVILVRDHPKHSIALGEKVLVVRSSERQLAKFL